ncbi:MAG TPA: VOC family protein [Chitinophagaceae bacterium]|nr:VOC family protein [Chitinophagaceae bacterium]
MKSMKKKMLALGMILFLFLGFSDKKAGSSLYEIRAYGIKVNVTDMKKALEFYHDKLGFGVESGNPSADIVFLKESEGKERVVLNLVNNLLPERIQDNTATFTLQVNDLDSTITALKNKGLDFGNYQRRKEGVGYAIFIDDPFRTRVSLMHQTIVKTPWFKEPLIYNFGFLIPDMNKAREFYCDKLGFVARSEKYLPLDLPLGHADKSFAFMLHYREGVEAVHYNSANDEHAVVLFRTNDLAAAIKDLKAKGVKFVQAGIQKTGLGNYISFYDPFGYVNELVGVK